MPPYLSQSNIQKKHTRSCLRTFLSFLYSIFLMYMIIYKKKIDLYTNIIYKKYIWNCIFSNRKCKFGRWFETQTSNNDLIFEMWTSQSITLLVPYRTFIKFYVPLLKVILRWDNFYDTRTSSHIKKIKFNLKIMIIK